ncbi:hypothetical protein HRH59_03230 [Rheinheimera sp. YQF-2]|uniref:HEPN AbiU2-like domain-containing protein n=1 Tax=Rheinheimera lutimaris TaxID=2740584 RepID=A0A7Y5EGN2_9GAMM|nr:hypothetical protein [Rheinheimera lutimaris]NRQ41580.1 hypothetical protein [Rheinheimera lutimaris]
MSNKVTTCTFDDFIKRYPHMAHLDPMNQLDFDLSSINQSELKTLKHYFSGICTDLTLYMQLFGQEEHVAELNKFNSFIFSRFERACLERICLKIATLMDPPKSQGKDNLSLRRFIEQTDSSLLQGLFNSLKDFYEKSGINDWRNKVLAHADLLTLSGEVELKVSFTKQEVDDFVAKIQEFIDWVSDPKVATDHQVVLPRDVDGYSFISKIKSQNES